MGTVRSDCDTGQNRHLVHSGLRPEAKGASTVLQPVFIVRKGTGTGHAGRIKIFFGILCNIFRTLAVYKVKAYPARCQSSDF